MTVKLFPQRKPYRLTVRNSTAEQAEAIHALTGSTNRMTYRGVPPGRLFMHHIDWNSATRILTVVFTEGPAYSFSGKPVYLDQNVNLLPDGEWAEAERATALPEQNPLTESLFALQRVECAKPWISCGSARFGYSSESQPDSKESASHANDSALCNQKAVNHQN
jgi:hypothetical protein